MIIAIKMGQKMNTTIRRVRRSMKSMIAAAIPGRLQSPVYAATMVAKTNRMVATRGGLAY